MKTFQDIGILVKEIEPKQIFKDPKLFVAFGFGSGLSKIAPGTMGSLVAILLWYPLSLLPFGIYALFLVACFYLGISICGYASVLLEKHDYGGIVFDEFLGYLDRSVDLPRNLAWYCCSIFAVSNFLISGNLGLFLMWMEWLKVDLG